MVEATVKVIDTNAIKIPDNRIRRDFDKEKIHQLATSIAGSNREGIPAKGLLHPIVLALNGELEYELVAGERRLRAMMMLHKQGKKFTCEGQEIPKDTVPFTLLGDLDPIARREAELEENTIRADLSWQEQSQAVAELHKLREGQHGKFDRSTGKGWRMQDTAEEVTGRSTGSTQTVRDAIALSEHLDDEEVAKAKTAKEAMKVLKNKHIAFLTEELAKQIGNEPQAKELDFRNEDMCEAILKIPDSSYDCIVTDPPYGIDAQDFGSQTDKGHQYDDDLTTFIKLIGVLATEGYRVLKDQAHMYVFCDFKQVSYISDVLLKEGFTVWPRPIIWDKGVGMLPVKDLGPRYTYECILYANKGKRPVTAIYNDVIRIPSVDGKTSIHAAQKPVDLFANLIKRCCNPGDTVLDPFAGSGTIFEAARATQCVATGFELSESMYNAAMVRLSHGQENLHSDKAD